MSNACYDVGRLLEAARSHIRPGQWHFSLPPEVAAPDVLRDPELVRAFRTLVDISQVRDEEHMEEVSLDYFDPSDPEYSLLASAWNVARARLRASAGLVENPETLLEIESDVGAGGMGHETARIDVQELSWDLGLVMDVSSYLEIPILLGIVRRDWLLQGLGSALREHSQGGVATTFLDQSSGSETLSSSIPTSDLIRVVLFADGLAGDEVWNLDLPDLLSLPTPDGVDFDWADLVVGLDAGSHDAPIAPSALERPPPPGSSPIGAPTPTARSEWQRAAGRMFEPQDRREYILTSNRDGHGRCIICNTDGHTFFVEGVPHELCPRCVHWRIPRYADADWDWAAELEQDAIEILASRSDGPLRGLDKPWDYYCDRCNTHYLQDHVTADLPDATGHAFSYTATVGIPSFHIIQRMCPWCWHEKKLSEGRARD